MPQRRKTRGQSYRDAIDKRSEKLQTTTKQANSAECWLATWLVLVCPGFAKLCRAVDAAKLQRHYDYRGITYTKRSGFRFKSIRWRQGHATFGFDWVWHCSPAGRKECQLPFALHIKCAYIYYIYAINVSELHPSTPLPTLLHKKNKNKTYALCALARPSLGALLFFPQWPFYGCCGT